MRKESREAIINYLVENDIKDIKQSLEINDTAFLSDVLSGNGFVQYNNLSDDALINEIGEQVGMKAEDRGTLATFENGEEEYTLSQSSMAGVTPITIKSFIENYNKDIDYIVYDKYCQPVK